MKYKIGQRIPITITRKESGFDRACEEAYDLALITFGYDDYGSLLNVDDSHRSEDSVELKLLAFTISGNMVGVTYFYKFEAWVERYNNDY